MEKWFLVWLTLCFGQLVPAVRSMAQFQKKPNLVVLIVIDQFRADYLTRFASSFLPVEKAGEVGGFSYLMNKGAYYPFAHYNVFQAMTCPGHAMIMTGAYPAENGISMNEWYDRESEQMLYCAKDQEFGISPRQLKTTTVSDEFKNIDKKGKVIAVALKDRAAVMIGGQRADNVVWMNEKTLQWTSSRYYSALPPWIGDINKDLLIKRPQSYLWKKMNQQFPYAENKVYATPFGLEITVDLALAALEKEKLGQSKKQTDFLLLSFSSHDYAGHLYGPNSSEMEDMTINEDRQISRLLNRIKKAAGLDSTLVILTADHGIPPAADYSQKNKIKAGRLDYLELFKKVSKHLDAKFGVPQKGSWIIAYKYFNLYLNPKVLQEKNLSVAVVAREVKDVLSKIDGIAAVFTGEEMKTGTVASSGWSEALNNQFVISNNGDVIFMPEPFYYELSDALVTHLTGYNYDTRVPLILAGAPFKPGVYADYARVIDLAPTLSFVLNLVAPPKARGRVLSESLR